MFSILNGYASGQANYSKFNTPNNSKDNLNQALNALYSEINEAFLEFRRFRLIDFVNELFDVWHTTIVVSVMISLPYSVQCSKLIWYLVFFGGGIVTPMKQGKRYIERGCTRSISNCKLGNHVCPKDQ